MIQRICDRCGDKIDVGNFQEVTVTSRESTSGIIEIISEKEICNSCAKAIIKVIDQDFPREAR